MLESTPLWRYSRPAIILHWVLAVLIASMVALGWYMMTIEKSPAGPWYFDLHRSVGLLVGALVLMRVLWRAFHIPQPLPASLPRWQVRASSLIEILLYICMVVMPVTGYLGSAYSKSGVRFFGLELPGWTAPDRTLSHELFSIHSATVWVLVVVVCLHAAAGIRHLVVDRELVFNRMWF